MTPMISMALELVERRRCSSAMHLLSGGKIGCPPGGEAQQDNLAPAMRMMVGGMVGDVFCGDVDIDQFKAQCRAPLFPNQWNVWRLYRTTRDNATDQEIVDTALAVFRKWFDQTAIYDEEKHGKFVYPKVTIVPNAEQGNPWKTNAVKTRFDCQNQIMLAPSSADPAYRTIFVRFVHRGSQTDMPWPVHKQQIYNSWCPVDADWILDTVYQPFTQEPVPPESEDPWLSPGTVPDIPPLPDLPLGAKVSLGLVMVGVGAIIGLAVLRTTG